ncbi:MAG: peptidylprolyl isomerase [Planctomycetota bacterium]
MMHRFPLLLCTLLAFGLSVPSAADEQPRDIPADLAAMHKDGKWKIRKRDLYVHLAEYSSAHPQARLALEDYLKQRIITREAAKRKVSVSDAEVKAFMDNLDKQVRKQSAGTQTLETMLREQQMALGQFQRRSKLALLRERVVRSIFRERDKTWPREKQVQEDAVNLTIDSIYRKTPKVLDPSKLGKDVLAKVGDIEITKYDYGRQLIRVLPKTAVLRALQDLVLGKEVVLLTGSDKEPAPEEFEAEKRAFIERERNRLLRMPGAPQDPKQITPDMIRQVVTQRGLTLSKIYANPGFRAQARARGHFTRGVSDEQMKEFYEKNRAKYGDRLRVRRILVLSRAQPVNIAGKKVRNLKQGLARANALHVRLDGGEDFGKVAKEASDDADFMRNNGGLVPLWLTADAAGFKQTWAQANTLKPGQISKPFFDAGRGYVIVQLVKRRRAVGIEAQRKQIRRDAAEYDYREWQNKVMRASLRSQTLFQ